MKTSIEFVKFLENTCPFLFSRKEKQFLAHPPKKVKKADYLEIIYTVISRVDQSVEGPAKDLKKKSQALKIALEKRFEDPSAPHEFLSHFNETKKAFQIYSQHCLNKTQDKIKAQEKFMCDVMLPEFLIKMKHTLQDLPLPPLGQYLVDILPFLPAYQISDLLLENLEAWIDDPTTQAMGMPQVFKVLLASYFFYIFYHEAPSYLAESFLMMASGHFGQLLQEGLSPLASVALQETLHYMTYVGMHILSMDAPIRQLLPYATATFALLRGIQKSYDGIFGVNASRVLGHYQNSMVTMGAKFASQYLFPYASWFRSDSFINPENCLNNHFAKEAAAKFLNVTSYTNKSAISDSFKNFVKTFARGKSGNFTASDELDLAFAARACLRKL
jgi:hypothetical protein